MAIYRGTGGSVDGITDADILLVAVSQGGTGASTASGARTNLGLGTAATTNATAYATAAQGTLADSAVQPGDLATVATTGDYDDLTNKPTLTTSLEELTDVSITSLTTNDVLQYNGTAWVNAVVSGGGGGSGSVTSVAMTVPTGLSVSGTPITSSGTLAVTYASGYSIPTTTSQTNWDTAYGWGNHASAGYLTSETYTGTVTSVAMTVPTGLSVSGTPITSSGTLAISLASGYSIPTTANQTNWNTAYGWGNHASAGYATNLDGLSDVTLTSPTSGQVLKYNGTAWINDTDSTGGGGGATYLPILNNAGSTIQISIAGGYISVTNRAGSTVSVPVY